MKITNINKANQQDIVKLIGIICMVIDHLGVYFFPQHLYMRVLGRLAFPIFAFYAGYNFKGSINKRVLLHGSILYLYSVLFIFHMFIPANILISICLGQLYLAKFSSKLMQDEQDIYVHYIVLIVLWYFTRPYFEYGSLTMLFMLLGYLYKNQRISSIRAAAQIATLTYLSSYIIFAVYFRMREFLLLFIAMCFLFYMLKNIKPDSVINYQFIKHISRLSLLIYSVHLVIIQFVWRYYFIL